MLLAQWMLRPIHVIQSGLTPAGPRRARRRARSAGGEEFRDLGSSFDAVSAQLSASRAKELPASATDFESVMDNLEDAVALFSPDGELMFANSCDASAAAVAGRGRRAAVARLPATIRCVS